MQTKWLKSLQMGVFLCLFVTFSLTGCSTVAPTPPVIISNNNEKDSYIKKVEEIVSESASALVAVTPALPAGIPREIIEGQIQRLSGLSKPSVVKVAEFQRIIKEKDEKAVVKDRAEAVKVDAETTELWAKVEAQNKKLSEANALKLQAELKAKEETKTRVVYQASSACLGLLIFGILVTAFSSWKISGLTIVALSSCGIGAVWWFLS
jgi:multidrug efflux pump subunit AcrB